MKLVNFTCPGCGAQLNVDADMKQATCQYCGMTFPIDDEAQHVKFDGAEQAGYEFEKGRLRAQQEQIPQTVYVEVQPAQPKPKRKTWLWVLGWIFIFPVPLTIIMLKNESVKEKLNPKARYAIIAVAWLLYLIIGLSGGGSSSENRIDANSGSAAVTSVASETSTGDELAQLQAFYDEFKASGTRDNLEDMAKKHGLYTDYRNTGTGVEYHKVAATSELAKVVSNSDLETPGNYIVIKIDRLKGDQINSVTFHEEGENDAASGTGETPIELIAGEKGAYGQELTMSEGTDMEEKLIVYYVPAGSYKVENLGSYRAQVNVCEGVRKGDGGYDEYTNTGDILMLDAGKSGELTVPEGWFIEIHEPTHVSLTPKA